jgi:predicted MPP superfamily phosphohydrolase
VLVGAGYSVGFEPFFLQRSQYSVDLRKIPGIAGASAAQENQLRILHLADLHFSPERSSEIIHQACSLGLHSAPDVIVVTGDLIDLLLPNTTPLQDILQRLTSHAPTFVTLGNHDGGNWASSVGGYKDSSRVAAATRETDAILLDNTSIKYRWKDRLVQFTGLGDLWSGNFSPKSAFSEVDEDIPTIVLSHNPDSKNLLQAYPWDLMLSGHTHGGQLRIPWIGATPFAPVRDKRFVSGLNSWEGRNIFTSSGVATSANLRFNVRPEVTIFDLMV